MKKLLFLFALLTTFIIGQAATTYTTGIFNSASTSWTKDGGDKTINNVTWNLATDAAGVSYTGGNNGSFQLGSSSKAMTYATFTTAGINGTITKVSVNAAMASASASGTLKVKVGNTDYGTKNISGNTMTAQVFEGSASGQIEIAYTQTTTKQGFKIQSITVEYDEDGGGGTVTPDPVDPDPVDPDPVGEYQYVKTDITDLQTGDVIIIVDTNTDRSLVPNGTSSAPSATEVTLNSDKSQITSGTNSNMEFTITVSGSNYQFAQGTNYLYTTSSNNGVRFGTNSDNKFEFTDGFLKNTATNRYIGVYKNSDWRCYTSIHDNIKNTKTTFYKKVSNDPDPQTCEAPVFSPAFGEVASGTTVTVACPTEGAKLNIMVLGDNTEIEETEAVFPFTFDVTEDVSIEAYAYLSEAVKSETVEGGYTVPQPVDPGTCADPVFSVEEGAVEPGTAVNISCPSKGATIMMLEVNGTEVADAEGKYTYDVTIYDNTEINVWYVLEDGETMSSDEAAGHTYILKNVEGAFELVTDFAYLNAGDQVVLVNSHEEFSNSMVTIPAAEKPAPRTIEVTDDKSRISGTLTNADIFTIEAIGKDAEMNETYTFRSNVLNNGNRDLYLQYGGSGTTLSIATLGEGSESHVFSAKAIADEVTGYKQLHVTSTIGTGDERGVRYLSNGWQASKINSFGSDGKDNTYIYKKVVEVAKAEAPTFDPASGAVAEGTKVTVTSATEGAYLVVMDGEAEIIYDGKVPYEYTVTGPIDLIAAAYLVDASGKKIAASESEESEASYTIKIPPMRSNVFQLATDIEEDIDYIFVGYNASKKTYHAMSSPDKQNIKAVAAEGNFAKDGDKILVLNNTTVARLKFVDKDKDGKYYIEYSGYDAEGNPRTGYLNGSDNTSKNYAYVTDTKQKATVSVSATTGEGTISIASSGRNLLSYNCNNTSIFACYSNKQSAYYLYKMVPGESVPTEPVSYHRSHVVREGVDYILVGENTEENEYHRGYYLMTGMKDNNSFGSTHEKKNEYVTMADDNLTLQVADAEVAVVNFERHADGLWAMKIKDGQHITRGLSGSAALSDDADPVAHEIAEGEDGYKAHLVHQADGDAEAQRFSFYANGSNSKFCSYNASTTNGTPLYLYASEIDPVESSSISFAAEGNTTEQAIQTGWDNVSWTPTEGWSGTPRIVTFATTELSNEPGQKYAYIYYAGLATPEDAEKAPESEGKWKYTLDSYSAAAAQADEAQTSPVALHVEVEMLGNNDGTRTPYKVGDPENPGDWSDWNGYIKYCGLNQTAVHDVDAPYAKIPVSAMYSLVHVTAKGDGVTHATGDEAPATVSHAFYIANGDTTGVELVGAGNDFDAEVKYYNLQGVRVINPGSGIYLRVQGSRVTKVML